MSGTMTVARATMQALEPARRATLLIVGLVIASASSAQYTPPGAGLVAPRTITRQDIDQTLEQSRWRFGALRVTPVLQLTQFGYTAEVRYGGSGSDEGDAQLETVGDFTATVGAGLNLYLPFGSKVLMSGQVLPQYAWFTKQAERRRVLGRYQLGVRGDFNHLVWEVQGSRVEELGFPSSEVLQRLPQDREGVGARLELRPTSAVSFFVWGASSKLRFQEEETDPELGRPEVGVLDRDTTVGQAEIRYQGRRPWSIGLGVQTEKADFRSAYDRSNDGISPFVRLRLSPRDLDLGLVYMQRSLDPVEGSQFPGFEGATGSFRANWSPGWRFAYQLYGGRQLGYSVSRSESFSEQDRIGVGLGGQVVGNMAAHLFFESGSDDYTSADEEQADRLDDVQAYGAFFCVPIKEMASLRFGAWRSEFDSNVPGLDRSLTQVDVGLSISLGKVRIELGDEGAGVGVGAGRVRVDDQGAAVGVGRGRGRGVGGLGGRGLRGCSSGRFWGGGGSWGGGGGSWSSGGMWSGGGIQ